jgi:hypothetical protein
VLDVAIFEDLLVVDLFDRNRCMGRRVPRLLGASLRAQFVRAARQQREQRMQRGRLRLAEKRELQDVVIVSLTA